MRRYSVARSTLRKVLTRISEEGWAEPKVGHGWSFQNMIESPEAYEESYLFRQASEPTCQKRSWSSVLGLISRIALTTDISAALTAAPASASLTGVAPSRPMAAMPTWRCCRRAPWAAPACARWRCRFAHGQWAVQPPGGPQAQRYGRGDAQQHQQQCQSRFQHDRYPKTARQ